MKVLRNR